MCTTEVLHQSGGVDQYRDCTFKGGGTSEIRFDIVFGVIKVDGASGIQDDGPVILLGGRQVGK